MRLGTKNLSNQNKHSVVSVGIEILHVTPPHLLASSSILSDETKAQINKVYSSFTQNNLGSFSEVLATQKCHPSKESTLANISRPCPEKKEKKMHFFIR